MDISIVIPTYKEIDDPIQDAKYKIQRLASKLGNKTQFELIYVFDGVLTHSIIKQKMIRLQSANIPNVKILYNTYNKGKGFGLVKGMAHAEGKHIGFLDYGREINPDVIADQYDKLTKYGYDIAIADKYHKDSKFKSSIFRKIISSGFVFVSYLFVGLKFGDTQTGAKLFKREVVTTILPKLTIRGYAIDVELLKASLDNGFNKVISTPVELHKNLDSGINPRTIIKVSYQMAIDTAYVGYLSRFRNAYKKYNNRSTISIKTILAEISTTA
ncbi:glycosyltransferase family 2 protein [Candidatus Dojkabacteria bacterium]|nr:glycosyltransferase family 2 protein [Candidatus Dojkabacteria bacterium]